MGDLLVNNALNGSDERSYCGRRRPFPMFFVLECYKNKCGLSIVHFCHCWFKNKLLDY